MSTVLEVRPMSESDRQDQPIRIGKEALRLAKIAAGYKDMSMKDWVTEVIAEAAQRDIEKGHRELSQPTPKPKRSKGAD